MKIYAAADLHGQPDRVRLVCETVRDQRPEAVVLAGDVLHYRHARPCLQALGTLPGPIMVIRGNTDPGGFETAVRRFPHFKCIDSRVIEQGGVRFVGLGGTVPMPFNSRIGWREARRLRKITPLIDSQTVLVVHPPPRGIQDRVLGRFAAGSRGLRRLVGQCPPAVVICGHIHEDAGFRWLGRTLVVNCALGRNKRGALIQYDGYGYPAVQML